jgi:competence ComEA-like helix-hairpin-helix protein
VGRAVTFTTAERRILAVLAILLGLGYVVDLLGVRRTPVHPPPDPPQRLPPLEESPFEMGLLDLNEADVRALQSLPGIGPSLADRIVEYRDQRGPFSSVEELLNVRGIGPKTLGKFTHLITVGRRAACPSDSSPKIDKPVAETTM